jgi:hypothetical protein
VLEVAKVTTREQAYSQQVKRREEKERAKEKLKEEKAFNKVHHAEWRLPSKGQNTLPFVRK